MAFEDKLEEVEELSDVQLRKELIKRGLNIGPVTGKYFAYNPNYY